MGSLAKKVAATVLAAHFDEELCSLVERAGADEGGAVVEALLPLQTAGQAAAHLAGGVRHEGQVAALLAYLHRFLEAFGADKLAPWLDFILQPGHLHSNDLRLREVLGPLLVDVVAADVADARARLLEDYFTHKGEAPLSLPALLAFGDSCPRPLFLRVDEYLTDADHKQSAMQLLATVVHRQGPHLHEIADTPLLTTLLRIPLDESDAGVVAGAVWVLVMVLPHALPQVPPLLSALLAIMHRLLHWPSDKPAHRGGAAVGEGDGGAEGRPEVHEQTGRDARAAGVIPPDLGRPTAMFFRLLYVLFPCASVSFLRREHTEHPHLGSALQVLLGGITLDPALVLSDEISELAGALERWKRRDPYALVADCFSLCPPPPLLHSTSAATERTGDRRDHDHGALPDSGWDERVRLLCEQLQAVPRHRVWQKPQQEAINTSAHAGEEAVQPKGSTTPLPHVRDSWERLLQMLDLVEQEGLHRDSSMPPLGTTPRDTAATATATEELATGGDHDEPAEGHSHQCMRQLVVARTELLFERFARRQLFHRCVALQREGLATTADHAHHDALREEVRRQQEALKRVQELLSERQRHIHQLNARHSATVSHLTKSLADLHAKNADLKAAALRWENTAQQALDDHRSLLQQLEQKSATLLELEAQVETMQAQAGDSLNFRGSLSSLNHELALWEERSKRESSLSIAELTEAQRQLHVQEALAADLNEQLHALHAKHHTLQTVYEEMKERAERAERERKDKGALAHTQKQLLEYHKQVSVHKLQAVEAKYAALKKSHLGLERHLVVLEAEAEKYRLLRHKFKLLSPSSTSSSPSAPLVATTPTSTMVDSLPSPEDARLPPGGRARSSTWHSIHPVEAAPASGVAVPAPHQQPLPLHAGGAGQDPTAAVTLHLLSSSAPAPPHDGPLRP